VIKKRWNKKVEKHKVFLRLEFLVQTFFVFVYVWCAEFLIAINMSKNKFCVFESALLLKTWTLLWKTYSHELHLDEVFPTGGFFQKIEQKQLLQKDNYVRNFRQLTLVF
jgi:hypothetical protein